MRENRYNDMRQTAEVILDEMKLRRRPLKTNPRAARNREPA
jgi:hypothetical protein